MKLLAFICLATQLFTIHSKVIDDFFPQPCSRSDPNLNSCVSDRLPQIVSHVIKNGFPGIQKEDAFELPLINFDINANNITTLNRLKNLRFDGLLQYVIDDVKVDGKTLKLEVLVTHPKLYVSTEIKVAGLFYNVPVQFEGSLKAEGTDIKCRCKMSFNTNIKDGIEHLALEKLKFKSIIGDMHVDIAAKDAQNQPLVDMVTATVNQNSKQVLAFIRPYYEDMGENLLRTILEKGLATVPLQNIVS